MIRERFKDKIVLITGAANGLGLGMAEQFLLEGAKIAVLDIEQDTLEKVFQAGRNEFTVECAMSRTMTRFRRQLPLWQTTMAVLTF